MEVRELTVFVAVAEELHFGRAAEKLHLAQPYVSRCISALEKELRSPLFHRTTRSVALTPSGEVLLGHAKRVLKQLRHAAEDVEATKSGKRGTVRIAFAGASTHALVGKLSRAVRLNHSGLTISLSSQNYARPALHRVISGDADISMGRWDHVPSGIASRVLIRERLILAVPSSHPLSGEKEVGIASFAQDEFVSLPAHPGSVLTDRLMRLAYAADFEPNVVQVAPDTWTALSLVAVEVGVLLTISSVAENTSTKGVSFVPLVDEIDGVELRMAWRRKAPSKNPALKTVLEVAEEVLL